jgi:hypothetical protein
MPIRTVATPLALALALAATSPALAQPLARLGIDASRATIDVRDVISGGPPPQGIPALGFAGLAGVADASPAPQFVRSDEAAGWLREREPVILVRLGGESRIYPLQVLTYHEIANDTLGGVPVAVTFCPLCNSALAFDRRVPLTSEAVEALRARGAGERVAPLPEDVRARYASQQTHADAPEFAVEVTFGVSGLLYLSNLLMFDDATGTLWSQLVGEGVVGDVAGARLVRYGAQIVSFGEAVAAEPDALVLSRETGFGRPYGRNPYVGYDEVGSPAFLFDGVVDGRLTPKARVVTIDGAEPVAYPFDRLARERVVHDVVADLAVVVLWQPGTATAIGAADIAAGADVGAVGVFRPEHGGRSLTFEAIAGGFVDRETGTRWDVTGRALDGPLAGSILEAVPHDNTLWFAWAAFRPETDIRAGEAP